MDRESQGHGAGTGAARSKRTTENPEFHNHQLNDAGQKKASDIAAGFDQLLEAIKNVTPVGREQALCKTHLEQAFLWANRAVAMQEANQQ